MSCYLSITKHISKLLYYLLT